MGGKTLGTRRKTQRGGAYMDLPSFMGGVHTGHPSMDPYNLAAGGYGDPTSAGSTVDARLGGNLEWNW